MATLHPSPEEFLIHEAVLMLTPLQRKIWDYFNYDKLSKAEIARKLKIAPQGVSRHLTACEKSITKFISANMAAYKLIKQESASDE